MLTDEQIVQLFRTMKTIAVVGLSNNPMRASYGVARFLQRRGFRIIPVNPNESEVLGERAYARVRDVADPIDVVDVFRRHEFVPPIVDELVGRNIQCLWLQEGVVSQEAAVKAQAAGIPFVMNRCILKELARLSP
jgi:predicted CoA-binding protein